MTSLSLLDWRRQVARLYADIRAEPDASAAHEHWQAVRDDLLKHHPQSPIPLAEREVFAGVPVAPYDAGFRYETPVDADVEPVRFEVATATDGVVPFERIGTAHLTGVGDLDVWWIT